MQGIHLLRQAVHRTAELKGQFVLLGTGHADGDFHHMAATDFKDSRDVKLVIRYSDRLAHLLYAAADIVLVPSLFEPCGESTESGCADSIQAQVSKSALLEHVNPGGHFIAAT